MKGKVTVEFELTSAGLQKAEIGLKDMNEGVIIACSKSDKIYLDPDPVTMIRNFETVLRLKVDGKVVERNDLRILD